MGSRSPSLGRGGRPTNFSASKSRPESSPSPFSAKARDHQKKAAEGSPPDSRTQTVTGRRPGLACEGATRGFGRLEGGGPWGCRRPQSARRRLAVFGGCEGTHKNCGIEPIFYLGNEARFRACPWWGQPLRGCAVAGVSAVLAGGFSGALGVAQPGAQGRAWSLRGGRLRGVFKPFHGASSLAGNAGGSCQCFSQQMPPAESSSRAAGNAFWRRSSLSSLLRAAGLSVLQTLAK